MVTDMTSPRIPWPTTRVSKALGIRYPIIQGPFGGGLSSVELAACVSNAGGLGSFGAHYLTSEDITTLVSDLRAATTQPFNVNLWVSTRDMPEAEMTRERFDAAVGAMRPIYLEAQVDPPTFPQRFSSDFETQAEALIAAAPPVFSVVFGIPDSAILDACRERGIRTIGTATTPDEAVALDAAGIDLIVASGFEAGGHRGAFLDSAEDSLVGTMALTRIAASEVSTPVVAAGGIADAEGVVAALTLGAEGVQIGTAFLATEESGAPPAHRALLFGAQGRTTRLTRVYSGRLARGIPNRLMDELRGTDRVQPYPYQGYLLGPVTRAAREQGLSDLTSLWSGQIAPMLHHRHAADLFTALVKGTEEILGV